ncbi:chemotaxis response regulator protein-glutamate methylesterase [Cohnella xylanilytica]|uniref:protein-glutamate methylesterase n=2 Tax=Cohnella xylanilytica TaxID=557555 RepID=A0A841TUX8_9BACL|nr:chemotaxis response regulator protein-glutamate methylesterase [Cohnella xylanilytica]
MLSAVTDNGTRDTIRALQYGAIDFIRKPDGSVKLDIRQVGESLREKLHVAIELAKSGNYRMLPEIDETLAVSSASAEAEEAEEAEDALDEPASAGKTESAEGARADERIRTAGPSELAAGLHSDGLADSARKAEPERPQGEAPRTAGGDAAFSASAEAAVRPAAPAPSPGTARRPDFERRPQREEPAKPDRDAFAAKRSDKAEPSARLPLKPSSERQPEGGAAPAGKPPLLPPAAKTKAASLGLPKEKREPDAKAGTLDAIPSPPAAVPAAKTARPARPAKEAGAGGGEDKLREGSSTFQHVVAIGTSTGGPRALHEVLTGIPADFPAPILVVQHMPPKFTQSLAQRLDSFSRIRVCEGRDGETVRAGTAYIAPGGKHMTLAKEAPSSYRIVLTDEEPRSGHKPSVDKLFESLVGLKELKRHVVIMTGMGSDGAKGMKALKDDGAETTIAEAEQTCIVYGMPRSAVELGAASRVLRLQQIAPALVQEVSARKR